MRSAVPSRSGLPPFFHNLFGGHVKLPIELIDEPISNSDNGYRPEITKSRPGFLFEIKRDGSVSAFVGNDHMSVVLFSSTPLPQKHTSNISVVTVYDTYGLEVAYSFLEHLYRSDYNQTHPKWIAAYLRASLGVLRPDALRSTAYGDSVLALSSLLYTELAYLDSTEPKMMSSLQPVLDALPPEVLSLIVSSERVAKSVTRRRVTVPCYKIPTRRELEAVADRDGESVIALPDGSIIKRATDDGVYREWRLTREGESWKLTITTEPRIRTDVSRGRVIVHSFSAYRRVFESRGCDSERGIDLVLQDLKRRIADDTISELELGGWYVLIGGHNDNTQSGREEVYEMANYSDLRDALIEMSDAAIQADNE